MREKEKDRKRQTEGKRYKGRMIWVYSAAGEGVYIFGLMVN